MFNRKNITKKGRKSSFGVTKHFLIIIFSLTFFTFSGVRDCGFTIGGIPRKLDDIEAGHGSYDRANDLPFTVAVGENGAIYRRGGSPGYPWVEVSSPTTANLNHVKIYQDSSVTFVVGDNGTVLRSRDTGQNWDDLSIPSVSTNLYGLDILDLWTEGLHVVVCGDNGKVYKSTNSGGNWTWQDISTGVTSKLNSIGALTTDIYEVVGDNGVILRTFDEGQTWEDKSILSTNLNRIQISTFYPFFGRMWAVGDNGVVLISNDYGESWSSVNSGTTENLYDLSFRSSDEGVIAGANGVVKYTTTGGFTWEEDPYLSGLTDKNILSVTGDDSVTASAILSNTVPGAEALAETTYIMTVSSEPIVGIETEPIMLPAEFKLFQNYPNPFNPSTKIKFTIPKDERRETKDITLKVYDFLGNEVATLVDAELPAGEYEFEFYSHSSKSGVLTSGVYFYKLEAGDFVETKKMILLK